MLSRNCWVLMGLALVFAGSVFVLWKRISELAPFTDGGTEFVCDLDFSHLEKGRSEVREEAKDLIVRRLRDGCLKALVTSDEAENRLRVRFAPNDPDSITLARLVVQTTAALTFHLVASPEWQAPERQQELEQEERLYDESDRAWVEKKLRDPVLSERRPQPPDHIVRAVASREKQEGKSVGKQTLENHHSYDESAGRWKPEGVISSRNLRRASASLDLGSSKPAVLLQFDGEGASAMGELTGKNIDRFLALVLDGKIMQVASIKERIQGNAQITGNFRHDEVENMEILLRGGTLPTTVKVISETQCPPLYVDEVHWLGALLALAVLAALLCMGRAFRVSARRPPPMTQRPFAASF